MVVWASGRLRASDLSKECGVVESGRAGRDGKTPPSGLVLNVTGLDGKAVASSMWEGSSNYASSFALSGDAIYIRGSNALLCVGKK